MVRLFIASITDSRQDDYFFMDFLPAMAFDHSSMIYKLEFLKNRWVHNLLAMCFIDRVLECTDNGQGLNCTLY